MHDPRPVIYEPTMRAMVLHELGGPERLALETLAAPEPGPGQISVDVRAIGCNFADTLICQGKYQVKPELPFSPGSEVAGTVRALGPGVQGLALGQRVAAQLSFGGYAEVAVADARRVQTIPDGVSFEHACALGIAYQTAYLGLVDRARLAAGESVLVHAAAGGVGLATVQLARALGARVIAGASADKLELCLAHGADAAVDTRSDDWAARVLELTGGRGADVICESVGGEVFERSLKCIAWGGRLVVVGFSSGEIPTVKLNRVMLKHIALVGIHIHGYHEHDPGALTAATQTLYALLAAGKLDPPISARFPLERAADALAELANRRSVGKLLLVP